MLKGAIIGMGKIAQEAHIPAFLDRQVFRDAKIIAAVDENGRMLNLVRSKYPEIRCYSSVDEMFEREDLDFIDICTPPGTHAHMIEEGLKRGVHIICEKPFVLGAFDAERLYPSIAGYQKVFMPVHQYKYSPLWKAFKEEASRGTSGKNFIQFNVFRTEADRGIASLNKGWRTDPELSGGGILSDTGVHYLYLSLWMLGEVRSITARAFSISHTEYSVEDTALVVLESEYGVAQISLTWGADRRHNSACLVNSRSSLVYNGSELIRNFLSQSERIPVPDASDKKNYISLYVSLVRDFLGQVNSGLKDNCRLDEAYKSIKLLDSCYRAAVTNRTITF